tara:strand:+ start:3415 stop:4074 length:660 start_codon:yes stop_codon:yes gene_type:complete
MAKALDISGQKFGRLTAIQKTSLRRDGKVVWLCHCVCGREKLTTASILKMGLARSCGCLHKETSISNLPKNTYKIGQKRIVTKGYIEVKTKNGFIREHVKVMQDAIGRKLYQNEVVHHIDENKKNNDISNLRLMTNSEHITLHNKGRVLTQETKEKISKANKLRTRTKGHIGKKLNESDVIKIKAMIQSKRPHIEIATLFCVSVTSIRLIQKNKTWRYI